MRAGKTKLVKKKRPVKRIHPKFQQMNYGRKDRKRVKENWRRPRGIDNKQRVRKKFAPSRPCIGWRNARSARAIHPSGFLEVRVFSPAELSSLEKGKHAVRIASCVGGRKRREIEREAGRLGLKLLN